MNIMHKYDFTFQKLKKYTNIRLNGQFQVRSWGQSKLFTYIKSFKVIKMLHEYEIEIQLRCIFKRPV